MRIVKCGCKWRRLFQKYKMTQGRRATLSTRSKYKAQRDYGVYARKVVYKREAPMCMIGIGARRMIDAAGSTVTAAVYDTGGSSGKGVSAWWRHK